MSITDLEDRLGGGFNSWPNMELVRVTEVDMSDPYEAYKFGYLMGDARIYRQIRCEEIPDEVTELLKKYGTYRHLIYAWVTLKAPHGQLDDEHKRNALVLIEPNSSYDFVSKKHTYTSPALVIEIGCDHDYETVQSRRCYTEGKCRKCQHTWAVDSSD